MTSDRRVTANRGFAIAGVPCFAHTFVQGESSVSQTKQNLKRQENEKRMHHGDN